MAGGILKHGGAMYCMVMQHGSGEWHEPHVDVGDVLISTSPLYFIQRIRLSVLRMQIEKSVEPVSNDLELLFHHMLLPPT